MNSWWLKLYTIPQIKKSARDFLIVTILATAGVYFFPEKVVFICLLYVLPVYLFFTGIQNGLTANLEFHKMTVPLKDLLKAYHLDMLIQVSTFFLLLFISITIPMMLYVPTKFWELNPYFLVFGTPSFFLYVTVGMFVFVYSIRSAKPFRLKIKNQKFDKTSRKKNLIFAVPLMAYVLFADDEIVNAPPSNEPDFLNHIIEYIFQFNFVFTLTGFFLCVLFAGLYVFSKHEFNMIKGKGFGKQYLLTMAKGFTAGVVFCFLCGGLSYFEFNSGVYSRTSKMKTLIIFSDFMPELEIETVRELLPNSTIFARTIMKKAGPAFWQSPVEEFIDEKNLYLVKEYILSGQPSERNLVFLMTELEKNRKEKEWKNPNYYNAVKHALVYKWPPAAKLPDALIAEKVETKKKRTVASEPKKTGP